MVRSEYTELFGFNTFSMGDIVILVSHRGNLRGKQAHNENNPDYIHHALTKGYAVEVDVWYTDGFYLGHDYPHYQISVNFLKTHNLWCHAKNLKAVSEMTKHSDIHYFWHQQDDITLTSKGYILCKPNVHPLNGSISILPEINNFNIQNCAGICSDNIESYYERCKTT